MDKDKAIEYIETGEGLDEVFERDSLDKLEELKRYIDTETLIDELIVQGPSSAELGSVLEYMGRMYDLSPDMRSRIEDATSRAEYGEIVDEMVRMWRSDDKFLSDFVRALDEETFDTIASETARLYDLPSDVRDMFRFTR